MGGPEHNASVDHADPAGWVDECGDSLYAFALARVGRPDLAEDLVQETFVAGLAAIESYRRESSLLTWLTGILRRKIADEYRCQRRGPRQQTLQGEPPAGHQFFDQHGHWLHKPRAWRSDPHEIAESQEFWETLEECMEQLPPTLAAAFRLKQLDGLKTGDVCSTLQISGGNLSVRMHRARLLLRECLDRNWFR